MIEREKQKVGEVISPKGGLTKVVEYYNGCFVREDFPHASDVKIIKGLSGNLETRIEYHSVKPVSKIEVINEGNRRA